MNIPDLSRAHWRKSSHSSANGACVEVAETSDLIAVRDSKDPVGPKLVFTAPEWEAFTAGVRAGEFDRG
jgi:predicted secreted Zn-dependent protease